MIATLFWQIATSNLLLTIIALVALAAFVVAHIPLIGRLVPAIEPYIMAAGLVSVVSAAVLCFLIGYRVSDERQAMLHLQAEIQWKDNELEQQKATAEDAERLKKKAEDDAREAKGKLNEFRDKYGDKPEAVCAFTPDDLERLRALRRSR
jgi:reverse gyrase